MKQKLTRFLRFCATGAAVALALVLAGCITKRIVWSPNGSHAAILSDQGLYLCDTNGRLSSLLVTNVVLAEWFPDSRRLALAIRVGCKSWPELEKLLDTHERERIKLAGEHVLNKLRAGAEFNVTLASDENLDSREKNLLGVYLRSLEATKPLVGTNWSFLEAIEVNINTLRIATVSKNSLSLGAALTTGLDDLQDLRVSPGGAAIACTTSTAREHEYQLLMVPADNSQSPKLIADGTAAYPDWSADGRSLIYIKAAHSPANGEEIVLASLSRRTVLDPGGKMNIQEKAEDLAGLVFDEYGRVRSLPDGRILFSAMDLHLPVTKDDVPQRGQLFALDPDRQATITRIIPLGRLSDVPENANLFEISPDGRRISFLGDKHRVSIFTLATGSVDNLQSPVDVQGGDSLPTWRSNEELCFIAFSGTNLATEPAQAVLWRAGEKRILSADWPKDVRKGLLDP